MSKWFQELFVSRSSNRLQWIQMQILVLTYFFLTQTTMKLIHTVQTQFLRRIILEQLNKFYRYIIKFYKGFISLLLWQVGILGALPPCANSVQTPLCGRFVAGSSSTAASIGKTRQMCQSSCFPRLVSSTAIH